MLFVCCCIQFNESHIRSRYASECIFRCDCMPALPLPLKPTAVGSGEHRQLAAPDTGHCCSIVLLRGVVFQVATFKTAFVYQCSFS